MDFLKELEGLGARIVQMVEAGIDLASEQLPEVARQAMAYWGAMAYLGLWTNIFFLCLFLGMIVAFIFFKDDIDDLASGFLFVVGGTGFTLCIILLFMASIPSVIKFNTAPTLFFLEHAAQLFK